MANSGYTVIREGDGIHRCPKPEITMGWKIGSQIKCNECGQLWQIMSSQREGLYWDHAPSTRTVYDPRENPPENPSYSASDEYKSNPYRQTNGPRIRNNYDYYGPYGLGTPFGS